MKRSTLLSVTLILVFQVTMQTIAQPVTGKMMAHPDYVSQLLTEINLINAKVDRLKQQARSKEPGSQTLLSEAAVLERKALYKQIEASELNFNMNLQIYDDNRLLIRNLQARSHSKENEKHIEFLVNDAAKNKKQATELELESQSQSNEIFKLGSLDNAQEKILLSLKQQNEVIELLERSGAKIAKNK